ncbi:hypothetical protein M885DRAFT_513512 [Pelagophyceae sp. CCMP2097]|nr:hypothetical protein M885DRAFT_513512 [Pelagophyceae sp. CCMP2097]
MAASASFDFDLALLLPATPPPSPPARPSAPSPSTASRLRRRSRLSQRSVKSQRSSVDSFPSSRASPTAAAQPDDADSLHDLVRDALHQEAADALQKASDAMAASGPSPAASQQSSVASWQQSESSEASQALSKESSKQSSKKSSKGSWAGGKAHLPTAAAQPGATFAAAVEIAAAARAGRPPLRPRRLRNSSASPLNLSLRDVNFVSQSAPPPLRVSKRVEQWIDRFYSAFGAAGDKVADGVAPKAKAARLAHGSTAPPTVSPRQMLQFEVIVCKALFDFEYEASAVLAVAKTDASTDPLLKGAFGDALFEITSVWIGDTASEADAVRFLRHLFGAIVSRGRFLQPAQVQSVHAGAPAAEAKADGAPAAKAQSQQARTQAANLALAMGKLQAMSHAASAARPPRAALMEVHRRVAGSQGMRTLAALQATFSMANAATRPSTPLAFRRPAAVRRAATAPAAPPPPRQATADAIDALWLTFAGVDFNVVGPSWRTHCGPHISDLAVGVEAYANFELACCRAVFDDDTFDRIVRDQIVPLAWASKAAPGSAELKRDGFARAAGKLAAAWIAPQRGPALKAKSDAVEDALHDDAPRRARLLLDALVDATTIASTDGRRAWRALRHVTRLGALQHDDEPPGPAGPQVDRWRATGPDTIYALAAPRAATADARPATSEARPITAPRVVVTESPLGAYRRLGTDAASPQLVITTQPRDTASRDAMSRDATRSPATHADSTAAYAESVSAVDARPKPLHWRGLLLVPAPNGKAPWLGPDAHRGDASTSRADAQTHGADARWRQNTPDGPRPTPPALSLREVMSRPRTACVESKKLYSLFTPLQTAPLEAFPARRERARSAGPCARPAPARALAFARPQAGCSSFTVEMPRNCI